MPAAEDSAYCAPAGRPGDPASVVERLTALQRVTGPRLRSHQLIARERGVTLWLSLLAWPRASIKCHFRYRMLFQQI